MIVDSRADCAYQTVDAMRHVSMDGRNDQTSIIRHTAWFASKDDQAVQTDIRLPPEPVGQGSSERRRLPRPRASGLDGSNPIRSALGSSSCDSVRSASSSECSVSTDSTFCPGPDSLRCEADVVVLVGGGDLESTWSQGLRGGWQRSATQSRVSLMDFCSLPHNRKGQCTSF